MLKKLRVQLTLLYLFAAIFLSLAVGGGTYVLVNYYFQTTNDQALWVKMGLQFASYGLPLPKDIYEKVKQEGLVKTLPPSTGTEELENEGALPAPYHEKEHEEGLQESELADIFVLPVDSEGSVIQDPGRPVSVETVNLEAVQAARSQGYDLRTTVTSGGVPVRLLTYKVPSGEGVQIFQIGRYLTEQQRVLQRLFNTMIILGGIVTILFGMISWILAGRTIKPSQGAWDKQQTFVSNASHELRTPLTLIHAGVELSLRKAESPAQKQLLSDVLADADYMNKLIEDLLLLSRLDSGTLKLELQTVALADLMPEMLRQVERMANNAGVKLQHSLADISLKVDPLRLKQILLVIFDNAIRNTPSGGIVKFEAHTVSDHAELVLSDTGPGVPQELIDKVFDRFYKVNDQPSTEYRGSGLGLSIAKSLVEAQHGTILLKSVSGEGTKVILTFPIVKS